MLWFNQGWACRERTRFILTSIPPHTMHLFCVSKLPYMSACVHLHVFIRLCGLRMCAGQCVSKERLPFKVLCVCERGGSTLSHSAGGKLLSFSFGSSTICISCHPPFSFFLMPPEKQNRDRRILELRGNRRKLSPKLPPASRLNTNPKIWVPYSADYVVP